MGEEAGDGGVVWGWRLFWESLEDFLTDPPPPSSSYLFKTDSTINSVYKLWKLPHSRSRILPKFTTYFISSRYGKTGYKKRATSFAILLQKEVNSDVARFTTHVRTFLGRFVSWVKIRNIAIQLVLRQCCKTACTFVVARFTVPLRLLHSISFYAGYFFVLCSWNLLK